MRTKYHKDGTIHVPESKTEAAHKNITSENQTMYVVRNQHKVLTFYKDNQFH